MGLPRSSSVSKVVAVAERWSEVIVEGWLSTAVMMPPLPASMLVSPPADGPFG